MKKCVIIMGSIVTLSICAAELVKKPGCIIECESERHVRRRSWPGMASDRCIEKNCHSFHSTCASKAMQMALAKTKVKELDDQNQEEEE